jgi:putative N-acetylmannosamine-6-phosphate epimerase
VDVVHTTAPKPCLASSQESMMDELNGRMIACQILITGLIARVANNSPDPLRFLTDFRDEIKAVVNGVNIAGMDNTDRVRQIAQQTVDELFSLMKPPSAD